MALASATVAIHNVCPEVVVSLPGSTPRDWQTEATMDGIRVRPMPSSTPYSTCYQIGLVLLGTCGLLAIWTCDDLLLRVCNTMLVLRITLQAAPPPRQ